VTRTCKGPVRFTSPALTTWPFARENGQGFARQKRAVNFGLARHHHAIHRHTATGAHQHHIAHSQISHGHRGLCPITQAGRARHFQRGQFLRGRSRHSARAEIQIAPRQQKENQHHDRFEIGMFARLQRS
jgi:hypothetical protein